MSRQALARPILVLGQVARLYVGAIHCKFLECYRAKVMLSLYDRTRKWMTLLAIPNLD